MDRRWELLWHALQDTGKDIELALSRGKDPAGGVKDLDSFSGPASYVLGGLI